MEALGTEAKENKRVPSLEGLLAWPGGEPAVRWSVGEGKEKEGNLGGEFGKVRVCWST